VHRVQECVGIHCEDYIFQPGRSRTCEHSPSGRIGFGKPTEIHPLQWSDLCKLYPTCPCTTEIQQSVFMVGTKISDGSSQKFMFGGALSLLQSFKGGTNGFLESMMTL